MLILIYNALKYTTDGFIHIKIKVKKHENEQYFLVFNVTDSGCGIK